MKVVLIDYSIVAPTVLASSVEKAFPESFCNWSDLGEDFFEFRVSGNYNVADLENFLSRFV